jgi:uncharacterized protein YqeY
MKKYMHTLTNRIREDMKLAMKSGDAERRDVLRLVESAIRNKSIELRGAGKECSDEEALAVISTQIKQRRESARQFREGNREDLAIKEEHEIAILETYVPASVSDNDLNRIVMETIAEVGASGSSDMGKVMGAVMAKAKAIGSVDGNTVREKVQSALASL